MDKTMWNFLKCGTSSFRRATLVVAVLDVILSFFLLMSFILGSTVLIAYRIAEHVNATEIIGEITDDIFNAKNKNPAAVKIPKRLAEDVGIILAILFLVLVDFVISLMFVEGVRKWDIVRCQTWLHIRVVMIGVFEILLVMDMMCASPWYVCIPDVLISAFRIMGVLLGYAFIRELNRVGDYCVNCRANNGSGVLMTNSVIVLTDKRKDVENALKQIPVVTITGPEDEGYGAGSSLSPSLPVTYLAPKNNLINLAEPRNLSSGQKMKCQESPEE